MTGASHRRERAPAPRKPPLLSPRGVVLVLIAACAFAAWHALELSLTGLVPQTGGLAVVKRFFAAALQPALEYESAPPEGAPTLLASALEAARKTVVFAVAGMSLALVAGTVLGFAGSTAWWAGERSTGASVTERALRRAIGPCVWSCARALIVAMRSVHELLWAVLFLAAFGLNTLGAVVALAIPYAGTLAKIFSEMIDEAPHDSGGALRGLGASQAQSFWFGRVPRAVPDMASYAFYRFECAIRSSAVLGFFGFPTLGYSISLAFENLHYAEVWTYLYALIALVLLVETWSGFLRRRFVA